MRCNEICGKQDIALNKRKDRNGMGVSLCLLAIAAIGLLCPEFFTNHLLHGFEEKQIDWDNFYDY